MEELKTFYRKNKLIIYIALFLLCVVSIFFQIIMPAISSIGSLNSQIADEQKKIADYKNSLATLSKIDQSKLSRDATAATGALPAAKDIQSMYVALTESAQNAGIVIRGFSVSVGDIFQKSPEDKVSKTGVPYVVVNVQVSQAKPDNLYAFSQALSKHTPLSSIIKADVTQGEGSMDIAFYYKPFDLLQINSNIIKPLSAGDQALINSLPH